MDCNDAFCRILGRSRKELLGRRLQEFNVLGDEDDVGAAAIEALISGAPASRYEKRYLRADGTATWVRINLSVLSRGDDLYAGIIEDINARKQAEAEHALALPQLRDQDGPARAGTRSRQERPPQASPRLSKSLRSASQAITSPLNVTSTV